MSFFVQKCKSKGTDRWWKAKACLQNEAWIIKVVSDSQMNTSCVDLSFSTSFSVSIITRPSTLIHVSASHLWPSSGWGGLCAECLPEWVHNMEHKYHLFGISTYKCWLPAKEWPFWTSVSWFCSISQLKSLQNLHFDQISIGWRGKVRLFIYSSRCRIL